MDNIYDVNWFKDWFNSPYYHILYSNRDYLEAELFIDNLVNYLKPLPDAKFLDLACGKGRHSIYLNSKKYNVTGIDLSVQSIEYAKQFENNSLLFFVHDMRIPCKKDHFNYVLNLFTSFGYFEKEEDNYATIDSVCKVLKPNGIFVLDFLNVERMEECIIPHQVKEVQGIEFTIDKRIEKGFIVKNIYFNDQGKKYHFQESVKMISLDTFKKYFEANHLKLIDLRGSYAMEDFDPLTSDRLILIAQKAK